MMNEIFMDMLAKGWLLIYMDNMLIHLENEELDQI
jgi:hypothetical protein